MSTFWTFIHPWSSHFLRVSIIPCSAYIESDMTVSLSPLGTMVRALLLPLAPPFGLSGRALVFSGHDSLSRLQCRRLLLQLLLLRCSCQGKCHLYIFSTHFG